MRKIVASKVTASSKKECQDFIKSVFKDTIKEDFLNQHIDEIEKFFDHNLSWDSKEKCYVNDIYKDRNDDENMESRLDEIDSYDDYNEILCDAYCDADVEPFHEIANSILGLIDEEDSRDSLLENEDDVVWTIQDNCPTNFPDFLDNTISAYVCVKASPDVKKQVFGTSSNINIATKCVKNKFSKEMTESLISGYEDWSGDNYDSLSKEEKVKNLTEWLNSEDKISSYEMLFLQDCSITINECLAIKDKDNRSITEIDCAPGTVYLNYGRNPYYNDEIKINLGKIKISDILSVSVKNPY